MNPTPQFDHRDPGTDEAVWQATATGQDAAGISATTPGDLDLSGFSRLVVLAAHPDDETLMCGGLIAIAAARSMTVHVIVATDGEASHPDSPTHRPGDLAETRTTETAEAVGVLAPDARLRFLHLTDGRAAEGIEEMTAAVVEATGSPATTDCLVVSTWRGDRHPDHEAASHAASRAAWRTDSVHLEAPLWFWHWGTPADLPMLAEGGTVQSLALSPDILSSKLSAMTAHRSQVHALGPEPGNEALLSPQVLSHFQRPCEVVVRVSPTPDAIFDDVHRRAEDPWSTRGSWYEERKRALTLAAVPTGRIGTAVEVGCSIGTLSVELSRRCDRVIARDESGVALETARRLAHERGVADAVDFRQCRVPGQWPGADASGGELCPDLIVLSEVGYFLSPARMRALARQVRDSGASSVLACHWCHPVTGWPLNAGTVHAVLDEELDMPVVLRTTTADVEIIVWSRDGQGGVRR